MARSYWPGENPIGKRSTISFTPDLKREVIGVVGDVKLRGVDVLEPIPMIYEPLTPTMRSNVALVIRGSGDAAALTSGAGEAMVRIDPQSFMRNTKSMEAILAESLSPRRFRRRSHEVSIRMAVGTQVSDIVRLVVLEVLRPAALGAAIGIFGA